HFSKLADYAARLAYALSRGRRFAPVALLDPVTSIWAHSALPGLRYDETAQRLMTEWTSLMRELLAAQRPYDNLDPLLLASASIEAGSLRIGEADYQVIVLPSLTNLERVAWTRLEEFVASGGTVVACGALPSEEIEPASDVVGRCHAAYGDEVGREPAFVGEGRREAAIDASGHAAGSGDGGSREAGSGDGGRSEAGSGGGRREADAGDGGRRTGFLRVASPAELLRLLDECLPADLRLVAVDGVEDTADGAGARRDFLLAQRREGDQDLLFLANASMA